MALEIKKTKKYGRGLYATRNIKTGELVEASPVVPLDEWEVKKVNSTKLNCYVFDWNEKFTAIALGFGSLFNHSKIPNVTYQNNYEDNTIEFMALRDIRKGEQLFINYGYDPLYGIELTNKNKEQALKNESRQSNRE